MQATDVTNAAIWLKWAEIHNTSSGPTKEAAKLVLDKYDILDGIKDGKFFDLPGGLPAVGSDYPGATPLLDSLGDQFGIKNKILAMHGGDKAKAEAWLSQQGYDGHAGGVATDSKGAPAIVYDSEFDILYRAATNDSTPWDQANYVSQDGAPGTRMPD